MLNFVDPVHPRPSSADLLQQLRTRFGFEAFRPGQREVIEAVLNRRDVLAVMPTGQGKSLCFQLPAILVPGLTVVVSPLIALMKDQVDALRARGIAASAFHSGLSQPERDRIIQDMRLGKLQLLYLAPERIQHDWFVRNVRLAGPSLLVVDEAHCISHWGHDFRPDYLRLGDLRRQLDSPSCLALTATATTRVQQDIHDKLEFRQALTVITGFRRPNLRFAVEICSSKTDKQKMLHSLLSRTPTGTKLIYCSTRRHVEELAQSLRTVYPGVNYYHAGLADELRVSIHEQFSDDRIRILVATNAFGMGIDKPDVRLVVHYDVPGSLEAYYQEAGRAGRDSGHAQCVLLFQQSDVATQEFFIQKSGEGVSPSGSDIVQRQDASRELLRRMVTYAYSQTCRQLTFLNYFGDVEETTLGPCGHCDVCSSPPVVTEVDETLLQQARMVLATVERFQGRFGATRVTDVLYGSTGKAVLDLRLHTTESFGRLRSLGRTGITRLIRRLAASGHIVFDGLEFPVVTLSAKGIAVLKGTEPLVWDQAELIPPKSEATRSAEKPSCSAPLHDGHPDRDLFERLRALRARIAAEEGVASFLIFHDKTLRHIATMRPSSISLLESVPGIGPAKLERYGGRVLQVVNGEGGGT